MNYGVVVEPLFLISNLLFTIYKVWPLDIIWWDVWENYKILLVERKREADNHTTGYWVSLCIKNYKKHIYNKEDYIGYKVEELNCIKLLL